MLRLLSEARAFFSRFVIILVLLCGCRDSSKHASERASEDAVLERFKDIRVADPELEVIAKMQMPPGDYVVSNAKFTYMFIGSGSGAEDDPSLYICRQWSFDAYCIKVYFDKLGRVHAKALGTAVPIPSE